MNDKDKFLATHRAAFASARDAYAASNGYNKQLYTPAEARTERLAQANARDAYLTTLNKENES